MLNERRNRMVDTINQKGTMTFSDLMGMFPNVSEMTLRKDLKALDQEGQIVRIHGGARSLETVCGMDLPLNQRLYQNLEKKKQIAMKARNLIHDSNSVFLDSGSTMTEVSKVFLDQPCTVFTGGLSCAGELSKLENVEIYLLGGRLNKSSLSVRDPRITSDVKNLFFDLAFISVNGFSKENGFSCRSAERCEMEKAVISRSSKVVVAMDSTKINQIQPFSICMAEQIDILVSDDGIDDETRKAMIAVGVEVI